MMEWPPKFATYDKFKSDLQDAIDKHPHFEDWLINKCFGRLDNRMIHIHRESAIQENISFSNIGMSLSSTVENLKQMYYNEQNDLIKKHIFQRSMLDLKLKRTTITKEEQEDYDNKKMEYDSIIAEQQKLIQNGCRSLRRPPRPNKSFNMILNEKLADKLQYEIKAHDELLRQLYKRGYSEAKAFAGYKPGYVFKMDELGLGYYRDNTETGNLLPSLSEAILETQNVYFFSNT